MLKKIYILCLIFASLDPVYYGRNVRVILMHATEVQKESKFFKILHYFLKDNLIYEFSTDK